MNHWNIIYFRWSKIKMIWVFFLLSQKKFMAAPAAYGSSQARGSNQSCSCWPTPQPQQHQIQGTSAAYAIACSNVRCLTHWMRPGIKPASSRYYVEFLTHWATTGTLWGFFKTIFVSKISWETFFLTVILKPYINNTWESFLSTAPSHQNVCWASYFLQVCASPFNKCWWQNFIWLKLLFSSLEHFLQPIV